METAAVRDLSKQEEELGLGLQSKSSTTQCIDVPIESLSKEIQILGLEENTNCKEMDYASIEVEKKDPDSKEQEEMNDSRSKEEEMNDSRSKEEEMTDSRSKEEREMKDSRSKEEEDLSKEIQILGLGENTNCTEMDSASIEVEEKDLDSKEQQEINDSRSKEEGINDSRSNEEEGITDSRSKGEETKDSRSKEEETKDSPSNVEEETKDSPSNVEEEMEDSRSNKKEKGCVETDSALKEVKEQDSDLKEEEKGCVETDYALKEVKEQDSDLKEEKGCVETNSALEEVKEQDSDLKEEKGCVETDSALEEVKEQDSDLKEEEKGCVETDSALEEVKEQGSDLKEEEKGCAETDSAALKEVKEQDSDLKEEEKDSDPIVEKHEIVFLYPVRPDAPDCSYYLRTGMCRYGSNCKFNHPPRQKKQLGVEGKENVNEREKEEGKEKEDEEKENETENENEELPHYPEREGQPECKYYLKTGGCKFGKSCRYNHPRSKAGVGEPADLNFLGLPIRPGERECPFYMRTGSCKFATNCKFHHPDPTAIGGCDPPPVYRNDSSLTLHASTPPPPLSTAWSRTSNEPVPYIDTSPSPYVPVMLPPHGVHPSPEWNGFLGPGSTMFSLERNLKSPSASAMFDLTKKAGSSTRQLQTMVDEFPERPGQKECLFYMKNGNCKFRSACRYDHPKHRFSKSPGCVLSSKGLPLRPDQIICSHYSRYGICKFGPSCKYDHPIDGGPAAAPAMPASDQPTFGDSSEEARMHM